MRIVEIQALSNGAHRNQTGTFETIPQGWAVIPNSVKTDNFPFGEVVAEKINGAMTVTEWTPSTVPEPEPTPEAEPEPTTEELLNIILGVEE
ncbi:MAG: hypothetical protein IJZ16_01175 [Clostridia bacterium]|nr:hypothetical protein [Clostridia bacterium]